MAYKNNRLGFVPLNIPEKWRMPLTLLLIAGLTVAVYWQVLFNEFITYDDTDYVLKNTVVRQGLSIKGFVWAFSSFHSANWHPLTWLSHMLDVELFGINPMGHHATSLLLHTVNALLLCLLLHRLTGFIGRSMFVALLFAIHPLHVESVVWVAERKDVLSTLFLFLTMEAYIRYVRSPSIYRYFIVTVLFALGLMAKQMLVTLPLILLLMDYWPMNRFDSFSKGKQLDWYSVKFSLLEKIPLFAIATVASYISICAQSSAGAILHASVGTPLLFAGNAFISYMRYILTMFWPIDLAIFYPFEATSVSILKVTVSIVLLIAMTIIVVTQRKKRPYLLFGWFWFLITLLPVIGFLKVGAQAIADRYTYIPLTGLFLIVAWGGDELASTWRKGGLALLRSGAVIATIILSILTFIQVGYWRNSFQLFTHALAAVERNWLAHNNIGIVLAQHSRSEEAIFHFRESVKINPNGVVGLKNLGNAFQAIGKHSEAIEALREAVRISPNDGEGHYRLGIAYLLHGDSGPAYKEYQLLTRLDEKYAGPLLDAIRMKTH